MAARSMHERGENRANGRKNVVGNRTFGTVAVIAGLFVGSALAGEVTPASVTIDDGKITASLTGKAGDAKAGRKWFVGRKLGNCLACHVNSETSDQQFHGEVGPSLDGVGARYEDAQLRAIVVNSKVVFGEETLMPAFYRTTGFSRVSKKFADKTILSAQQVEDIVAYLKTLTKE